MTTTTKDPATKPATKTKDSKGKAAKPASKKSTTTDNGGKPEASKPATTSGEHPAARRAILKKAGLSENSDLTAEQAERADSEVAKNMAPGSLATFIMKGGNGKGGKPTGSRKPRADGKLSARDAALKVLKNARGKPLPAKVAAERLLALKPAPITGKYAQANAQKAFYNLIKSGDAKRDKDGKITLA